MYNFIEFDAEVHAASKQKAKLALQVASHIIVSI